VDWNSRSLRKGARVCRIQKWTHLKIPFICCAWHEIGESSATKRADACVVAERKSLTCLLLDLAEHRKQSRFHPVTVEGVFPANKPNYGLARYRYSKGGKIEQKVIFRSFQ